MRTVKAKIRKHPLLHAIPNSIKAVRSAQAEYERQWELNGGEYGKFWYQAVPDGNIPFLEFEVADPMEDLNRAGVAVADNIQREVNNAELATSAKRAFIASKGHKAYAQYVSV